MEFDTLEKAQAEILRQQEKITELTNERDTLSQNIENLTAELGEVRKLNQQYFNKLCAQNTEQENKNNNDEEVLSCEEFAKTLNF